jgi:hypothetical protein
MFAIGVGRDISTTPDRKSIRLYLRTPASLMGDSFPHPSTTCSPPPPILRTLAQLPTGIFSSLIIVIKSLYPPIPAVCVDDQDI